MKKLLFIFLMGFANSFAQGNLQFNQVINVSNRLNVATNTRVLFQTFTVPQGKVLKIENASVAIVRSTASNLLLSNFRGILSIDNFVLSHISQTWGVSGGIGDIAAIQSFPYWLGPGTYNFYFHCISLELPSSSANNADFVASFSAIEFNVISN